MKSKFVIYSILVLSVIVLSCKEKPRGDEFNWSPDGKKLAMVNPNSDELLVVDVEKDHLGDITPIDTGTKIFTPRWSSDGQLLLYSKIIDKSFEILVYSISESTTIHLNKFSIPSDDYLKGYAFPGWSPKENRILYVLRKNDNIIQMYSIAADGKSKKLLTEVDCKQIYPTWSPDGQWIAYSMFIAEGDKNNGLWRMKSDGSNRELIYKAYKINQLQWSPDGSYLALIKENKTKTDLKYGLIIIDSDGNEKQVITWEKFEITKLDWSPDGQKIAYVQKKDDLKNIWMVDITTQQNVKLTFDNVADYFGWGAPDQLFFTIKYPKDLVTQSEAEREKREAVADIFGVINENLLISIDNFKPLKLGKNIYSFQYCLQNNAAAYFRPFSKTDILSSDIYFAEIKLPDENSVYPSRTKHEYLAAADENFLNQRYQHALNCMSKYWEVDFNAMDFRSNFDVDSAIFKMKTENDSSQMDWLLEQGAGEGALLKTILIMRRMGQTENSNWMYDQFKKLIEYYLRLDKKDQENGHGFLSWAILRTYGKYHEFVPGIHDLEELHVLGEQDSLFRINIYFAQALLALADKQYLLGLEKVKESVKFMPANFFDDLNEDDITSLLAFHVFNLYSEHDPMFISILQDLVQRFEEDEDIIELLELLGDHYQKTARLYKAFEVYQAAVTHQFNEYKIWEKIFELEVK